MCVCVCVILLDRQDPIQNLQKKLFCFFLLGAKVCTFQEICKHFVRSNEKLNYNRFLENDQTSCFDPKQRITDQGVYNLTFGTAAWNKKVVKGDMVPLVARRLMFMACVPDSFSNEKSTFNPAFSTAVTVG